MEKILLFAKDCERCIVVKGLLAADGLPFEDYSLDMTVGMDMLRAECRKHDIDPDILSGLPVMIQGDSIWSGEDCLVAIEENEIAR